MFIICKNCPSIIVNTRLNITYILYFIKNIINYQIYLDTVKMYQLNDLI